MLFVAVPYGALPDVGKDLADLIKGKVIIDACNPFLIRDIGYEPVLIGGLERGKYLMPGTPLAG